MARMSHSRFLQAGNICSGKYSGRPGKWEERVVLCKRTFSTSNAFALSHVASINGVKGILWYEHKDFGLYNWFAFKYALNEDLNVMVQFLLFAAYSEFT